MRKSLTSLLILALAGTASADVLLSGFENIPAYSGNAAAWSALGMQDTVDVSTVAGVTGNAMQMIYNYDGSTSATGSGYHSWTMTAPVADFGTNYVDLSDCQGFRLKVKSTGATTMATMFYFYDRWGQGMRLMCGKDLADTSGQWVDLKIPFATQNLNGGTIWGANAPFGYGLQKNTWGFSGAAIDLANIAKISINVYDIAATQADGTVTFAFDDMYAYSGTPAYRQETVMDFNSYADQTALLADWVATAPTTTTLTQGTAADGKKTLNVTVNSLAMWDGKGAMRTLPSPIDMTNVAYAAVELEGDAAYASYGGLFQFILTDAAGKTCNLMGINVIKSAGKGFSYMPLYTGGIATSTNGTSYSSNSCWRYGTYAANAAANASFNMATVSKVTFLVSPQSGTLPSPAPTATVKVKKILFGGTSAMPAAANVSDWSQF